MFRLNFQHCIVMKDVFVKFPHGGLLLSFQTEKKRKKDDQKHSLASFSMNEWKLVDIAFVAKKVENKKEKICFSCVYLSPWKLVTKIPKRHYFRHFFLFLLEINSKSKFLFLTNI